MAFKEILYAVTEGILTITLNRPHKLNAFTPRMRDELISALDQADADDDVRVIIVTGAGRAFCAGADLSMGANTSAVSVALARQMLWRMQGAAHPMQAHRIESRAIYATGSSADAREGIAAFLQKRPAQFSDRPSTDMPDFFPWEDEVPFD